MTKSKKIQRLEQKLIELREDIDELIKGDNLLKILEIKTKYSILSADEAILTYGRNTKVDSTHYGLIKFILLDNINKP